MSEENKCAHTEMGVCPDCGMTVIVPAIPGPHRPTVVPVPERPAKPWTPPKSWGKP